MEYDDEYILQLKYRMEKIKERKDWIQVKTIIEKHNPNIKMVKNRNGYFVVLNDLEPQTYVELDKFLKKVEKQAKKAELSSLLSSDFYTEEEKEKPTISKKLRLTNTETHILNRTKYEKELKKNELDLDSDIETEYFSFDVLDAANKKTTKKKTNKN